MDKEKVKSKLLELVNLERKFGQAATNAKQLQTDYNLSYWALRDNKEPDKVDGLLNDCAEMAIAAATAMKTVKVLDGQMLVLEEEIKSLVAIDGPVN
jgi:hypothetical protein